MNELNKLFGSLLLLGGGFLAASLIGPPDLADRLSQLIKPTEVADANGLRPLPSGQASPQTADAWPQIPATVPPRATDLSGTSPSFAAARQTNPAPAFQPPAAQPITRPTQSTWPATPTTASQAVAPAEAPNGDWLTGDAFDFGSSFGSPDLAEARQPNPATAKAATTTSGIAPARSLTPVARRKASTTSTETAVASSDWPRLNAPLPPRLAETDYQRPREQPLESFDPTPRVPTQLAQTQRAQPPSSLDQNPYGDRPGFDAFAVSPPEQSNPLRFEQPRRNADPVERTPIAKQYQRHVVTDGDTLASLAARYLGNSARAQELFELNRDRLDHPDVLPIGMVLKAPEDRGRRQANQPAGNASPIDAFPPLPENGTFSTVAATDNTVRGFARDVMQGLQRPMIAVGAPQEESLSERDRLGPIDPLYNQEVSWDANRW